MNMIVFDETGACLESEQVNKHLQAIFAEALGNNADSRIDIDSVRVGLLRKATAWIGDKRLDAALEIATAQHHSLNVAQLHYSPEVQSTLLVKGIALWTSDVLGLAIQKHGDDALTLAESELSKQKQKQQQQLLSSTSQLRQLKEHHSSVESALETVSKEKEAMTLLIDSLQKGSSKDSSRKKKKKKRSETLPPQSSKSPQYVHSPSLCPLL